MDVVALGEVLIDFAAIGQTDTGYPIMQANPGGAPANFLAALAKYGHQTAFLGKVGNDAFGSLLEMTLKEKKIDVTGLVRADDVFTTLAFVTLDAGGDRSFSFARKPGADASLTFEELRFSLIEQAKVFHFGTVSMTKEPAASATKKAVMKAKAMGKWISYDPNLRKPLWDNLDHAKEAILWGLAQADVVKISDQEVAFLWGLDPQEGAKKILQDYGVKLVFVTLGAVGCHFRNAQCEGQIAAPKVKTIDTTGAGDIFGGSALSRILKTGKSPEELSLEELTDIVSFAVTAASLSTEKSGGIESVPEEADVLKRRAES